MDGRGGIWPARLTLSWQLLVRGGGEGRRLYLLFLFRLFSWLFFVVLTPCFFFFSPRLFSLLLFLFVWLYLIFALFLHGSNWCSSNARCLDRSRRACFVQTTGRLLKHQQQGNFFMSKV